MHSIESLNKFPSYLVYCKQHVIKINTEALFSSQIYLTNFVLCYYATYLNIQRSGNNWEG